MRYTWRYTSLFCDAARKDQTTVHVGTSATQFLSVGSDKRMFSGGLVEIRLLCAECPVKHVGIEVKYRRIALMYV